MGQYDNFKNEKRIKHAQKELDKLKSKRKPNLYKIDIAQKQLEIEKLFQTCQVFGDKRFENIVFRPNACIMFSDDNQVVRFFDKIVPYAEIQSYSVVDNKVTHSQTHTKKKGGLTRALVGGAIAGEVGAIVGAATAGSKSETTYYETNDGFYIQIFRKNGQGFQFYVKGTGLFSNKLHKDWNDLFFKLDTIIEENKDMKDDMH